MKSFSDFNIAINRKSFIGNKIGIDMILNQQISVLDFKIEKSKYDKGHGRCLYLQIKIGEILYVVFSGSLGLIDAIEQVPKEGFPFTTKVIKQDKSYQFT